MTASTGPNSLAPQAASPARDRPAPVWHVRLPVLLSLIAGMVDVIGFLNLKVFAAHVTGNLVMIGALLAGGYRTNLDQDVAVPSFVIAVALVWVIARTLRKHGRPVGRPLLFLQSLLLAGVVMASVFDGHSSSPDSLELVIDTILALSAMACQYSVLRLVMPVVPSTAVMTGNLTSATLALFDVISSHPVLKDSPRRLGKHMLLLLAFITGCIAGAAAARFLGPWAWAIPAIVSAGTILAVPGDV
ncbi:MAG TPA: YoaK family protein [Candidatus Angelobacter sp.]|jgi:uncharacterized membrane protein YoaK (UPF0700 family)|nr:YoaK family protein [Candidatus Angelobacter sp.]